MSNKSNKKNNNKNDELKIIAQSLEDATSMIENIEGVQSTKDAESSITTESVKNEKSSENVESPNNLNELKDVLHDLKSVLENLGVNISKLEVSLSTPTDSTDNSSVDKKVTDNDTLLISEIQNKVVLPYTVEDLQKILDSNKTYKTFQDVIDNVYTFPLDKYKSPTVSRFKEAYNLMRKKEKSSIFDSLSLGTELVFNRLLNPAVISACNSLDELDTYLDCLSSNELDKFNFFKVKYEILPQKQS